MTFLYCHPTTSLVITCKSSFDHLHSTRAITANLIQVCKTKSLKSDSRFGRDWDVDGPKGGELDGWMDWMAWLTGRYERLFYRSIYYTKHFWIAKVCWTLFDRLVGKQQGINTTTTNDSCLAWPATTKTTTAFFVVSYPVFILNLFQSSPSFCWGSRSTQEMPLWTLSVFYTLEYFLVDPKRLQSFD